MNIVLIGYRGSGKSTVGKRLAQLLGMAFVDTDVLIIERAGRSIREIFAAEGETGFRERESAVIQEVAARSNTVIAAGGGAILRPENVVAMKRSGKVVWLQAEPEVLHARISGDSATAANRPHLTQLGGGVEEIRAVLEKRLPLYAAAADVTIDIGRIPLEEAVAHIQESLADR
ncbi:MAG TPA: shikimate kinase [Phycisphaerae bacterium]|nr:shikimate kinase [Phycisphaerae bacterium]